MLYLRSQPLKERSRLPYRSLSRNERLPCYSHGNWPGKNLCARRELQRDQTRFAAQADWQAAPN